MTEDYWNKPTILSSGAKFYSEDTKVENYSNNYRNSRF